MRAYIRNFRESRRQNGWLDALSGEPIIKKRAYIQILSEHTEGWHNLSTEELVTLASSRERMSHGVLVNTLKNAVGAFGKTKFPVHITDLGKSKTLRMNPSGGSLRLHRLAPARTLTVLDRGKRSTLPQSQTQAKASLSLFLAIKGCGLLDLMLSSPA
jgi:hypothetical protein